MLSNVMFQNFCCLQKCTMPTLTLAIELRHHRQQSNVIYSTFLLVHRWISTKFNVQKDYKIQYVLQLNGRFAPNVLWKTLNIYI